MEQFRRSERAVSRPLKLGIGLIVALVVIVIAAYAMGILGAPSVVGVENAFGPVNSSTTIIESELRVNNPNPIGVTLGGLTIEYRVRMNNVSMAAGTKRGVSVETGNSTVPFRTAMNNSKLPAWWVSHIENGEQTTLAVDANIHSSLLGRTFEAPQVTRSVETNIIGAFNAEYDPGKPLNANREPVVQDPVMYLNATGGEWGAVDRKQTEIAMTMTLYNPKPYPITVTTVGYDISMNNISMGAGKTERTVTIPPGETRAIEATTVIRNQRLDEWWVSHLKRNQVTRLRLSFYLRFDLSAAGAGSVRVPLDDVTKTIETDIFGNKDPDGTGESAGSDDTDSTPAGTENTESDETTATPTDTPTPTPTATPTPTPTPTPTETDDII